MIQVNFNNARITDAGLEHLKGLTKLQTLWLPSNNVTDAGLVHLTGFTKLRRLHLGGTKITDAGVKELQTELPKCRIYR